jgi:Zn-dependent peptidase ImmA (M78 family)/predicted secreted protein
MSNATRDAVLRGVSGAAEAHDAFRSREAHEDGLRAIDVFDAITDLQIPLVFEALDELLGACVRVSSAEVGILVTSRRDLHMQRFTAAHELGHFVLGHEGSLDREVRMPGHTSGRDIQEVEADAFAAEFLMPKWLVKAAAQRRAWWGQEALQDPEVVYQLSLRLAASYEATCWGLVSHSFISRDVAKALVGNGKRVKEIKARTLKGARLEDPWADVWLLGPGDDGAVLDAGPNDVFIFEADEKAAAGFRWDLAAVNEALAVVDDTSTFDHGVVGGASRRRLVFQAKQQGECSVELSLRRSFARATSPRNVVHVSISTVGTRQPNVEPTSGDSPTIH